MKKKLKIGILFGGKSAEHEVSIQSAKNVLKALDKKKYQVFPIKIPRNGRFNFSLIKKVDVVFPVLHGPFGEDGSMQGLLKLSEVPFVGASVLGSAVGMDKDVSKRLLRDAGIAVAKFLVFHKGEKIQFKKIRKSLGLPMFVKSANMGSSLGTSKVRNEKEFNQAVKEAYKFDTKIIIEEFIEGREIECAVIGNENPIASVPGEIIISQNQDFFSYDAKYLDDGLIVDVPARLPEKTKKKVRELAIKVFKVLNCEGMGRVDFFVEKNGKVIVNEINTIPGPVMFRKAWESSGLSFPKLLDKLIDLALERFEKESKLKTTAS